jgi:hypothetical protein
MVAKTLDNMDDPSTTGEVIPFQFRQDKTEKGTLEWLRNWFAYEYEKAHPRYVMYRRFINMYKNIGDGESDGLVKTSNRDRGLTGRKPKIRDNFIYSYTEQRVSRVSRKKVALAYIPQDQTAIDDINAAEAAKLLVDYRYSMEDFDSKMTRMDRTTYLLGHSLFEVCWNPDIGPIAPSFINAREKFKETYNGKVPMMDENGEIIPGKFYDSAPKIGDMEGKLWQPYRFFPEPGKCRIEHADYLNTYEWMNRHYVEHKWKKSKDKITGSQYVKWDYSKNTVEVPEGEIMIHTFWHRPTEFFPEGCKIVWCDDMILSWDVFPYEYGDEGFRLPFVEERDIELEEEYWGLPFVINIEQFYKVNNSLISGMARNHGVLSAPKYVYPEGSVDTKSLNNEFSGVAYRGAVEPKVLQHNYVNRGELEFQKYVQGRAGEHSTVFEISRGIVPNGIEAATAIRYLDEQEAQRANPSVQKRNSRIVRISKLYVKGMAQFYQESDGRTVRIVGRNNEFVIKSFKKLALNRIADIRVQNSSAIADTKTGAVADIIDLNASNQKDPVFGRKEIIKLLDLGLDEAFKDEASYAVETAKTILQMMLEGEKVPEPQKTDGLFEFYSVFGRFVESITYKMRLKPPTKQAIDDYIEAVEMLMWQKKNENPKFAEMLMAGFEKYPMFFSPPEPPAPPMMPPGAQGAAPGAQVGADTTKMGLTEELIQQDMKQQGEEANA